MALLVKFVRQFEDIMKLNNAESSNPRKRSEFEGYKLDTLLNKIKESTKEYDKPIYSIWADKVLNKKLSYEDLKKITDESIQSIGTINENRAQQVDRKKLSNVVFAYEAMVKIRESRGGWWKAFHLWQNYKESKYLEDLSTKRQEYLQNKYPVQDIFKEASKSIMKKVYDNTKNIRKK